MLQKELHAAHVVAQASSSEVMREANLHSLFDTRNGVMLCATPCHHWYDQYHWWLDEEGCVRTTDALVADEELSKHFGPLEGQQLAVSEPDWPMPATWAVQRQLCAAATEKLGSPEGQECV